MSARVAVVFVAVAVAGCFSGRPLPGAYSCTNATSPCPVNYVCIAGLCQPPNADLGGVAGGGGGGIAGGGGGGGTGTADVGDKCTQSSDCQTANCDTTNGTCELAPLSPGWVSIGPMAFARLRPTVLLRADHSIMAAGGGITATNTVDASVEVYLPASSKWQDISGNTAPPYANLFYANQSAAAAELGGTLYIAGGGGQEITLQKYVPAQGMTAAAFVSVTNNTGVFIDQAGSAVMGGKLYVFGGYQAANVVGAKAEYYDPTVNPPTGTWTSLGILNTARRALAGVLGPDGTIYAMGGHGDGSNDVTLASIETYVPASFSWVRASMPMPQAREDLAAATGPDGRIYVIGGLAGGKAQNTVMVYTPLPSGGGRWTTGMSMPSPRSGLGAVTGADGLIYVIGGADASGTPLNTAAYYGPKVTVVGTNLQGSNFAANAVVSVYDAPTASGTAVGTGTTDMNGLLGSAISLSMLTTGVHTLTVMDNHSRYPVQTTYTAP